MGNLVAFAGGDVGRWRVERIDAVVGPNLGPATHVDVIEHAHAGEGSASRAWTLFGVVSNLRYTTAAEREALAAVHAPLGRAEATCAVLIPIRKSDAWWALAQDERRSILEEESHHIAIGLEYLPAVARRLHHSRDLGEPFDFLTWFEFAPDATESFDELLRRLRATPEWRYVDREVEVRLRLAYESG